MEYDYDTFPDKETLLSECEEPVYETWQQGGSDQLIKLSDVERIQYFETPGFQGCSQRVRCDYSVWSKCIILLKDMGKKDIKTNGPSARFRPPLND